MSDSEIIHKLKVESFLPLLIKYKDYDTNPANEKIERVKERLLQEYTDYYLINYKDNMVGAIRVVKLDEKGQKYRISPVFIKPEYQGLGICQRVFKEIGAKYNKAETWELETILQEKGNCYLYEKLG